MHPFRRCILGYTPFPTGMVLFFLVWVVVLPFVIEWRPVGW